MGQADRRRQKGVKKLEDGDGDSILQSEHGGAKDLEMDEFDALGKYEPGAEGEDEDDFGDFKAAKTP